MNFSQIEIKKLDVEATLPTRAHADDAGLDLYCLEDVVLTSGQGKRVKTGIAVALQKGFVGLIADRSSLALKGLKTAGGVIDAGYRGEIQIVLWNIGSDEVRVQRGERIAQMLILPIATPAVKEVGELDQTTRGSGGFGSLGK